MEGVSVVPILRDGDWKLVWKAGLRHWGLYNLAADRTETHHLAEKHPDRVKSMAGAWESWAHETEALIW